MTYEPFPSAARFATKFHKGNEYAPDGWPAETNPLADGQDPPAGYFLRTGAELNALRAKLHTQFLAICDGHQTDAARRLAMRIADIEAAANIGAGFEWPAGSGQLFSLSLSAQANLAHDAAAPDEEYPLTRATLDERVVVLKDRAAFASFYAAARAELRKHIEASHETKRRAKGQSP